MAEFKKERIIEDLKASTQNASGMFEISEETICALMSMLTNAAPQLPQPAVLSASEGVLKSLLPDAEKSEFWFEHNGKIFFEGVRFNNAVFEACRAAMLQAGNSPATTDGSKEALSEAVAAIYFDDSSDYFSALWSVVRAISPKIAELLESNERAAFDSTRLPAAPQQEVKP